MKNFNLGFHKLKKNQCFTSTAFKHMTPEQQSKAKAAQSEHLLKKELREASKRPIKLKETEMLQEICKFMHSICRKCCTLLLAKWPALLLQ